MKTKIEIYRPVQTTGEEQTNGWKTLLSLLDPVVIDAPNDKSIWQRLEPELVRWLINTVSKSPWFNHLTLAGIIFIENARPARPITYLQALHPFFNWAIPALYPDMTSLEPEEALLAYFGEPPTPRGRHALKAYSSLQFNMRRFLETSPEKQVEFAPFLLPTLSNSAKLRKFIRVVEEKTKHKRKEQAFAVVRELTGLVALGRRRYKWLVDLEAQYQQIAQSFRQGQITLPTTIQCRDLDNRKEIVFRVWDRISWIKAHQETYGKRALQYDAVSNGALFMQLVGELPDTPWFLRAIDEGVFQGPLYPTPQSREYLQEWQLPYPGQLQAGLLDPSKANAFILGHAKRTATGKPDDSRIIFCIEPLLAGATVGLVVLVCLVQTGMRIGELMQVTLDRECVETGFLPQFSEESDAWVRGPEQTYFKLYPKGSERRERYLVTDQMLKVLKILFDLHERYYGKGSFKQIAPCSASCDFSHARRFAEKRKFVLQWNGHHLKNHVLEHCLDFLLLEHPCRYPNGMPVRITTHILRHGVAGWLRNQGIPLEDILALLKQVNISVTDYYSKPSPQDLYIKDRTCPHCPG